jgi:hypothetical protein
LPRVRKFRQGIEKSVEVVPADSANKIISNTRDSPYVKNGSTDWVATQVTPLLYSLGLKYLALSFPAAPTRISVDNFKSKADDAVQIRYFDDQAKAKAWLESVDTAAAVG